MPRTSARGGPQTRARILAVATSLFLERGYDPVTVAEIAREAGVSSVTVFNHFPRKEDLFLDRVDDAHEFLRAAIRDRAPDTDALASLEALTYRLADDKHPLSGLNDRSVTFFRTVAGSPALIARARELAADLQQTLTSELTQDPTFKGDPALLSAFFIAGYTTVLVETARHRIAESPSATTPANHRRRLNQLFTHLREGTFPSQ
ncbi:TetR/AcrR family transcriptional regulator [Kribbella sp. NPDC051620]|uniref:TetR/AcrR family transcriptional regulator n=1 Tax=Kribbella sp. NPDC051620 TaxID=3364120 RepID=UPI003795286A